MEISSFPNPNIRRSNSNSSSNLENSKYALSEPSQHLESLKTIQQGDSTLEGKKAPYLTQTENQIQDPTYQTKYIEIS